MDRTTLCWRLNINRLGERETAALVDGSARHAASEPMVHEPLAFRGGVLYQSKDRLPPDRALTNKSAVLELTEETS